MKKKWLWGLVAIVLCIAIEAFFFKGFLWSPNKYLNPFGGDGYFISYHMNYHTQHGVGLSLNSMNYPHGEVLLMTDAQAMISLVLNKLKNWGIPIEEYVVGVMNGFNFYLLPFCILLLYLIFVELKTPFWYAALAALLIGLLSPQINRIVVGHYGLGYPFLLPLLIYWMMRARRSRRWYGLSILVGGGLIFFGFNNFYLLLMGGGFCIAGGLFLFLLKPDQLYATVREQYHFSFFQKNRLPIIIFLVGFLPMLIGFILVKSLDQVEDRVKVPFGFLKDLDVIPSLVYPPNSFTFDTFAEALKLRGSALEAASYVGLVPIIILIVCLVRIIVKRKWNWQFTNHSIFNVVFYVGIAYLLLAMHFPFFGSWKDWGFELPVLPQFRAQRRFIWGFYYCFTILMTYWGYQFISEFLKVPSKRWAGIVIILLGVLVWGNDVRHYLMKNSTNIFFTNPYTGEKLDKIKDFVVSNNISKDRFQAVYFLPTMNAWSDKVMHDGSWGTYFYGMKICVATGIPMINPMLSRVSVSQALAALQVVSDPLISRKLFDELPNEKPILLIKGVPVELHENELWVLNQADTIASTKEFVALAYNPWEVKDSRRVQARAAFHESGKKEKGSISFEHYDNHKTEKSFYGQGALKIKGKNREVWTQSISSVDTLKPYEASLWVYVDTEKFGMPFWKIEQSDANRKVLDTQRIWTTRSRDTQNGWVRVTIPFDLRKETTTLKLLCEYQFDCWMDEFLIQEKSSTIIWETNEESNYFSYNNFLISKE